MSEKTGDARAWEIIANAERFATHDPAVEWPDGPHDNAVDALMAAIDEIRERQAPAPPDYAAKAVGHVQRADEWANRDGAMERDFRERMVDQELRLAQIHATLAVAQQISMFPSP